MNQNYGRSLMQIGIMVFLIPVFTISQLSEIKINAGTDQRVNFEKIQTIQLQGTVSPEKSAVCWSCPADPRVLFQDAHSLITKVTFPCEGYYLIKLTAGNSPSKKISDTVIINVFKAGSYKQRLTDLINLMTLDEKICQLTNLSESIPRLNVSEYNYWNEALHGILAAGTTSFPQAVALGATWDPDLVYQVASAISDEARVLNATEGKGLTYWSPTVNIARDPRWGRNEECYSEDPYLLARMAVAFVRGMQGDHPYYLKTVSTPKHFIANNEETRRHSGSSEVDMRSFMEYYLPAFKQTIIEAKAFSVMCAYNRLNQVPCCGNYYLLTDLLRNRLGFEGYVVSDCGAIHDMVSGHHFFKTSSEATARAILAGCDLNCGEYYRLYISEAIDFGYLEEKDLDQALSRVLAGRFRLGEFDPVEMVPYKAIPEEKLDCREHRDLALKAAKEAIVLLKNDGILPLDKKRIKSIAVIGPNASECQLGIYSSWPNIQISPLEGIQNKAAEYGIKVIYAQGCEIGGGFLKPIETKYFSPVDHSSKKGMTGEYFANMNLAGKPIITRIDSMINFRWGIRSPAPGKIPKDQFSVRWTGKIIPPETRIFKLGTRTDDGARLYLDKKLLFEDWTEHGEKPNSAPAMLEAGKEHEIIFEYFDNGLGATARLTWDIGEKDFKAAKEIARRSDLVILCIGTNPGLASEEFDRMDISLPQVQQDLIREVARVNTNIIFVLINGGPVALGEMEHYARAIVEAWYGGQAGGTAIAEAIFGEVNPGGKLPETFYASTGDLPPFADYDLINKDRTYMYFEKPVLYPFGFGLSYTRFTYSNLKLNADKINKTGGLDIQCNVKNSGSCQGDEVVQLYVHDLECTVKTPIHRLKGFQRITLKSGEEKTVSFKLPISELAFYNIESNDFTVEPGQFEIQIGSSSKDIRLRKVFAVE